MVNKNMRERQGRIVHLLVLGAKLQGVEAIYLGKKAGYFVTAVDRRAEAPGADMADVFLQADIFDEEQMLMLFEKVDAVLPVIEDCAVLEQVREYGRKTGKKVIFDWAAYEISSSKELSNNLFKESGLPIPGTYPHCQYPVILKPDGQSGSSHVEKAYNRDAVEAYLVCHSGEKTVIQEYLEGPSYSLEVVGDGEHFFYPQITEVIVDQEYDCKRIKAPASLTRAEQNQMQKIAEVLADRLKIRGIFDIEVISSQGQLKLLEIDARLPSQTPISVYHSSGINMVELLVDLILGKKKSMILPDRRKTCLYQQVQIQDGKILILGEHIMGECSHLQIKEKFFGADEVITDYRPGCASWKAIVIVTGNSEEEAWGKFQEFIKDIQAQAAFSGWEYVEG